MNNSTLLSVSVFLSAVILAGSVIYHAERLAGADVNFLGAADSRNTPLDTNTVETGTTNTAPTPPTQPSAPQVSTVSVDDDPVLGDPNAPVTLIEFSDYECPFCQRHFQQTYSQLKEEYIDTGKVKLVFRDLPLSFHDPMATKAAMAANCVRDQGGDEAYFNFHDSWFTNTASNGSGVADDRLVEFANSAGVNGDQVLTCVENETFKEEVTADLNAASQYGATATPSFFIGESTGDEFEAELLVGAQPFSAFQSTIDKYLGE